MIRITFIRMILLRGEFSNAMIAFITYLLQDKHNIENYTEIKSYNLLSKDNLQIFNITKS